MTRVEVAMAGVYGGIAFFVFWIAAGFLARIAWALISLGWIA